jgi:hypothetical protein
MNASHKYLHPKRSLKPMVLALAFAMQSSAALAASMDDVVKTRADQNIDPAVPTRQRLCLLARCEAAEARTDLARGTLIFGKLKTYTADAWQYDRRRSPG